MKKLKFIERLELWWFYLAPQDRNAIEFVGGVIFFIALFTACLWFGYAAGKAGFGS